MGYPQLLREYLIATSYAAVQRNLPSDANKLINLLPITCQRVGYEMEVELNSFSICLSQDVLWNASMMLLSPQQRIVPFRSDIWVKLWDQLAKLTKGTQRFKSTQVVEKLMVSLVCYQVNIFFFFFKFNHLRKFYSQRFYRDVQLHYLLVEDRQQL